jgi:hypothetical protein
MGWREDVKFGIARAGRLFLGDINGQMGAEVLATAAEINSVADKSAGAVVSITAATLTLTQALHAGKKLILNKVDGIDLILPEATGTGDVYDITLGLALTSDTITITAADTTNCDFAGVCNSFDADNANIWEIFVAKQSDSYDIFTMDMTTQGGITIGFDWVRFTDITADIFKVEAQLYTPAGSEPATPFSTTT